MLNQHDFADKALEVCNKSPFFTADGEDRAEAPFVEPFIFPAIEHLIF